LNRLRAGTYDAAAVAPITGKMGPLASSKNFVIQVGHSFNNKSNNGVSRLSSFGGSSIAKRPTFDQLMAMDKTTISQFSILPSDNFTDGISKMATTHLAEDTKSPFSNKYSRVKAHIAKKDENLVGSGDNFFPNNISTALV